MTNNRTILASLSASLFALAGGFGAAAAIGLCSPGLAHAEGHSADGIGTWQGSGVASGVDGSNSSSFTVVLTRSSLAAGGVRSDGKLHMSDGKDVVFWQETTQRGGGKYRITSSLGAGGGSCFANGMCQSLEQRADGHAFASTIAADGPDKVRVLVTELQDGRAVRFFAQTLVKKP